MMRALLLVFALSVFACGKSKPNDGNGNHPGGKLERPGALAHPPGRGLPDDLRPPR